MDELFFSKYEGAGNDFIAIDQTSSGAALSTGQLLRMCNRKTGIGADGVLELRQSHVTGCSFRLVYYNADGREGSLCGNGARCSLAFAQNLGFIQLDSRNQQVTFEACDGAHKGGVLEDGQFFVDMRNVAVADITHVDKDSYFLDNGSPHHVTFVRDLADADVVHKGRELRWGTYGETGANINFAEAESNSRGSRLTVRTYERGVEDETLACGTGACASAIAAHVRHQNVLSSPRISDEEGEFPMMKTRVSMKGGTLEVQFKLENNTYTDIRLCGPARHVYDGKISIANLS
ncbi:hypothetical protein BaRGS_00022420 [Batillaria attramentaria]|uniref:Diaminopimelate epimerase n=1 Tax=Batillaria attramentaria TaxID=370345 RepID=A0ABD0KGZ6_9CAEN